MQDRIQKEKEFHNIRFNKETRDSLDKYYSISFLIEGFYQNELYHSCKNKRLLEYGCGLGKHSFELAKVAGEVYSIDISDVAIDKAQKKALSENVNNTIFKVMNAESLEFPNGFFDSVCGISILHHLDLEASLSELSRVLKPDGKAFFIEPLGHNPFINLFRKLTSNLRTEDEHPLLNKDLILLNQYFSGVKIKYYYLTCLFTIPFRNKKMFVPLVNFFNGLDQLLFKMDFFKSQAWQVVIEVSNKRLK